MAQLQPLNGTTLWQSLGSSLQNAWQKLWVKIALVAAGVAFIALVIVAEVLAGSAKPKLRDFVVSTLTEKFHAPVSLDDLSISVLRGLEVDGTGLKISAATLPAPAGKAAPANAPAPPLLAVKSFSFHVSLLDLIHLRQHVETVHIEGLEVHVPPSQPSSAPSTPTDTSSVTASVGHIVCTDAHIYIASDKPGTAPLHFDIENLDLKQISTTTSIPYSADIVYPNPKATVHLSGNFGPWNAVDPGTTPLDGSYSTSTIDLKAIAGLSGKLTSSGTFSGKLAGVVMDGKVDSPDLSLQESAHPIKMDATYHLTVDGTTGDTTFAPIKVYLPRGEFVAQGKMHIVPGEGPGTGPEIDADITVPRGRIEELLEIGTNTKPTLMSGALNMRTHLHVPPGAANVEQKMQATGSLTIDGITMGDPKLQQSINSLSGITQGNFKVLTGVLPVGGSAAAPVTSNINATFSLSGGLMTVPTLVYTIPGSKVQLAGVYSLARNAFEFKGHYVPEAGSKAAPQTAQAQPAQQQASGLFGMFQKAAPLLQKAAPLLQKVANLQVPIVITGVGSNVKLNITQDANESTSQMAADLSNLH